MIQRISAVFGSFVLVAVLAGGFVQGTYAEEQMSSSKATAILGPTQPGSMITGKVTLEETSAGLQVRAEVQNAPAGIHGFHIHMNGDCSDAGNAAGGHFNPDAVPHGDLMKDGFAHAHAGDLGNITIETDGHGTLEKLLPGLTLKEGKYGVAGRSFILHEKTDDFGQPTGNAGGRIACGVIQAEN